MKTAKRIEVFFLLAMALLSGLAACAQNGSSNGSPVTDTATPVAATTPPRDLAAAITAPADAKARPADIDTQCRTDADCAIKDVGSCCGANPRCVNVDSPTFPEQVQAECAASGQVGICGHPSISGCQCVAGQCRGTPAAGPEGTLQ